MGALGFDAAQTSEQKNEISVCAHFGITYRCFDIIGDTKDPGVQIPVVADACSSILKIEG